MSFLPDISSVVESGVDLIKSYFPPDLSPEDQARIDMELNQLKSKLINDIATYNTAIINAQKEAVVAEASSDNWLASNWRPITMLTFVFIIANNYIIYPYASLFFENAPKLDIPTQMWELLKIGLGGYVVGRSLEKIAKNMGISSTSSFKQTLLNKIK